MMFNKQRETLQQVAGLYMPAWAVRASCIFSISESISMFCVRASQEESLLADRVAQLSSLWDNLASLKDPLLEQH